MKADIDHDCVVIGSGPNGLGAAITLQARGFKTHIIEKQQLPGGGLKSDDAFGADFIRDTCAAIHPMAILSPFFRRLDLPLEWIYPDIPCAHPLKNGDSVALYRAVLETIDQFGPLGKNRYRHLFEKLSEHALDLAEDVLGPLFRIPQHPRLLLSFGMRAIWPATIIARYLADEKATALFAGMAAHSFLPFHKLLSGAAGIMLMLAGHNKGWPLARFGSGQISHCLIEKFKDLGGTIETGREVLDIRDLSPTSTVFFDTAPQALANIAECLLPTAYVDRLKRYRYGPAAYKIDYLLSEPIPWLAKDCRRAGTIHLGGSFAEITNAENMTWKGQMPTLPFMLVAQPSLFDRSRVLDNREIAWSYAHVPHGFNRSDVAILMENHIESFAPGFKDCIIARKITTPENLARDNPNLVGGDIIGGIADIAQTIARPVFRFNPYSTPHPRIYLCSASTPPGAGVHGMCGVSAAEAFLRTKQIPTH